MQFDVEINNKSLTLNGVGIINDSIFGIINAFLAFMILGNLDCVESAINTSVRFNRPSFLFARKIC